MRVQNALVDATSRLTEMLGDGLGGGKLQPAVFITAIIDWFGDETLVSSLSGAAPCVMGLTVLCAGEEQNSYPKGGFWYLVAAVEVLVRQLPQLDQATNLHQWFSQFMENQYDSREGIPWTLFYPIDPAFVQRP